MDNFNTFPFLENPNHLNLPNLRSHISTPFHNQSGSNVEKVLTIEDINKQSQTSYIYEMYLARLRQKQLDEKCQSKPVDPDEPCCSRSINRIGNRSRVLNLQEALDQYRYLLNKESADPDEPCCSRSLNRIGNRSRMLSLQEALDQYRYLLNKESASKEQCVHPICSKKYQTGHTVVSYLTDNRSDFTNKPKKEEVFQENKPVKLDSGEKTYLDSICSVPMDYTGLELNNEKWFKKFKYIPDLKMDDYGINMPKFTSLKGNKKISRAKSDLSSESGGSGIGTQKKCNQTQVNETANIFRGVKGDINNISEPAVNSVVQQKNCNFGGKPNNTNNA